MSILKQGRVHKRRIKKRKVTQVELRSQLLVVSRPPMTLQNTASVLARSFTLFLLLVVACDEPAPATTEPAEPAETESEAETEAVEAEAAPDQADDNAANSAADNTNNTNNAADPAGEHAEIESFLAELSAAWNRGDHAAYLGFFAETLTCFHGNPEFTRASVGERRTAEMMERTQLVPLEFEVLSAEDDRAIVVEHGAWFGRSETAASGELAESGIHHKALELVRENGQWRIQAEAPARRLRTGTRCGVVLPAPMAETPESAARDACQTTVQSCNRACDCSNRAACNTCRAACTTALATCVGANVSVQNVDSTGSADSAEDRYGDLEFERPVELAGEPEIDLATETVLLNDNSHGDYPELTAVDFLSRIPQDELSEASCRNELRCTQCDAMEDGNGAEVCRLTCVAQAGCFACGNTRACCNLLYDQREYWPYIEARTGDSCTDELPPYLDQM